MTDITNPFEQQIGKLYAAVRPYFHPAVINRIKNQLNLQTRVAHGVDVGCGTDQSSVALTDVADCISAFDPKRRNAQRSKTIGRGTMGGSHGRREGVSHRDSARTGPTARLDARETNASMRVRTVHQAASLKSRATRAAIAKERSVKKLFPSRTAMSS